MWWRVKNQMMQFVAKKNSQTYIGRKQVIKKRTD